MTITDRATGITEHIRATLPTLSPAERRVADELLRDPQAVIHQSVTELALRAETSAATVVRLCTSVGLRGFQDLKITLARETIPSDQRVLGAILPEDDDRNIVRKVLGGTISALEQAVASVDAGAVARLADIILSARRVHFGAVGTSAPLASDAAYRLTTIGIDATFNPDVHAQHVGARMLGSEDVFFAISHTGSTFETIATTRAARTAGATVVALTSFTSSPLVDLVDHAVIAGSPEVAYRVEAMASRIVHLALFDAIFVLLTMRSPDSADYQNLTADVLIEHRI